MIYLFRYENNNEAFTNTDYVTMFASDNLFNTKDGVLKGVSQLGILALPGTLIFLNKILSGDNLGIIVNWTGIFEIDLTNIGGTIESLQISPPIGDDGVNPYLSPGNKIIIDVLYDSLEGGNQ